MAEEILKHRNGMSQETLDSIGRSAYLWNLANRAHWAGRLWNAVMPAEQALIRSGLSGSPISRKLSEEYEGEGTPIKKRKSKRGQVCSWLMRGMVTESLHVTTVRDAHYPGVGKVVCRM